MEAIEHPGAMPMPPAAISRVLSRFSRDQIAAFTEIAIDLMDFADGDPDLEEDDHPEDDDPRGGNVEDEGEAIDEREPEHEGAADYGVDQDAPISDNNPVIC